MRNLLKATVVAGLFIVGGFEPVQAQQALRKVTFHAPFAFQVEQTKLPAGDYTILVQSGWVQIQAKNNKSTAQVLTLPVASPGQKTVENSHVVFHNYAGRMFLAEVWASGQEKGRELMESGDEQHARKQEKMTAVSVPAQLVAAK